MYFKLIIYALALYGVYTLFFKNKTISIQDKKPPKKTNDYTDYEEL
ncbi:MAG: hypothetical protein IPK88_07060 [Saprospiraceae bacterium]|jgi:hypothetical protein|uniref:Uncharacterized protein n=1 Tax=Candidatus Defluviibacterium haderslevense TaxID=2981993 RepID=A0A9D7XFU4_9BACT|nr:hypothetical protein [Candidatus Defluviibacterium haderslevense]MCC7025375.1 hypothetical protein [Saprospiraceae bacterium]MBK7243122.1 hypothetical protein [Candidatus Defluviibacterium haderslevense]MBK8243166.1 hypothetical protein [Candidatus Defluviibacterium haderslevense]MBK9716247.1 hypothetical protein [Candidatus Defluviibacterium haderslevense]